MEQSGVDAQFEYALTDTFSFGGSASYNTSEVQDDVPLGTGRFLPTTGKSLVETPEWTYSLRANWDVTEAWSLGLQGKYVGERFTTDVNDEEVPSYVVVDFDSRYDLTDTFGIRNAFVQFNVSNLFDEEYPASISSGNNATNIDVDPGPGVVIRTGAVRTFSLGSPRTMMLTLGTSF